MLLFFKGIVLFCGLDMVRFFGFGLFADFDGVFLAILVRPDCRDVLGPLLAAPTDFLDVPALRRLLSLPNGVDGGGGVGCDKDATDGP